MFTPPGLTSPPRLSHPNVPQVVYPNVTPPHVLREQLNFQSTPPGVNQSFSAATFMPPTTTTPNTFYPQANFRSPPNPVFQAGTGYRYIPGSATPLSNMSPSTATPTVRFQTNASTQGLGSVYGTHMTPPTGPSQMSTVLPTIGPTGSGPPVHVGTLSKPVFGSVFSQNVVPPSGGPLSLSVAPAQLPLIRNTLPSYIYQPSSTTQSASISAIPQVQTQPVFQFGNPLEQRPAFSFSSSLTAHSFTGSSDLSPPSLKHPAAKVSPAANLSATNEDTPQSMKIGPSSFQKTFSCLPSNLPTCTGAGFNFQIPSSSQGLVSEPFFSKSSNTTSYYNTSTAQLYASNMPTSMSSIGSNLLQGTSMQPLVGSVGTLMTPSSPSSTMVSTSPHISIASMGPSFPLKTPYPKLSPNFTGGTFSMNSTTTAVPFCTSVCVPQPSKQTQPSLPILTQFTSSSIPSLGETQSMNGNGTTASSTTPVTSFLTHVQHSMPRVTTPVTSVSLSCTSSMPASSLFPPLATTTTAGFLFSSKLSTELQPLFSTCPSPPVDGKDTQSPDVSIEFEPIVSLPEVINVTSGEEDEEEMFVSHAKLYRFDNKTWKDRGVGNIKILKNVDKQKARIVMRRDQTFKICCNHWITSDMSLVPFGSANDSWLWFTPCDFSYGEPKAEKLVVKFKKQPDVAKEFKEAFDKAKHVVSGGFLFSSKLSTELQPLFSTCPSPPVDGKDTQSPDVSIEFEPIVSLPEVINVTSGEEDEE